MFRMIRRVLLVGSALALAACGSTSPTQQLVVLPEPLGLDVARVEVVSNVQGANGPGHVESRIPITPEQALRDWATTRLSPRGQTGVARFTITEASIVEQDLDRNVGLPGLLRAPQTVRYDGTVAGILEIYDGTVPREGQATARAAFSRTIWPTASEAAHQDLWQGMVAPLVKTFDVEMTDNIQTYLKPYLR